MTPPCRSVGQGPLRVPATCAGVVGRHERKPPSLLLLALTARPHLLVLLLEPAQQLRIGLHLLLRLRQLCLLGAAGQPLREACSNGRPNVARDPVLLCWPQ